MTRFHPKLTKYLKESHIKVHSKSDDDLERIMSLVASLQNKLRINNNQQKMMTDVEKMILEISQ